MACLDDNLKGGEYLSNCYVKPTEGQGGCSNDAGMSSAIDRAARQRWCVREGEGPPVGSARKGQGPVDYILIRLIVSYIRVLKDAYYKTAMRGRQHQVREPAATLNEDAEGAFEWR